MKTCLFTGTDWQPIPPEELYHWWGSSLLYGCGLFETMAVVNGRPLFLDEHLRRMKNSAEVLALPWPGEAGVNLSKAIYFLVRNDTPSFPDHRCVLRLTLLVTSGEKGEEQGRLLASLAPYPYREVDLSYGWRAGILPVRRNSTSLIAYHKTLNYLENYLMRRYARQRGWQEGIFLNEKDYLAEGTATNVFVCTAGRVITPPVKAGLLPGIVRQVVLELCRELSIPAYEGDITPEDLWQVDEVFVTNSLIGLVPLTHIDDRPLKAVARWPLVEALRHAYHKKIKNG